MKDSQWLVLGVVLVVAYYLFSVGNQGLPNESYASSYCVGNSVVKLVEVNGSSQLETTACSTSETCFEGVCTSNYCSSTIKKACNGLYSFVETSCYSNQISNKLKLCPTGTYCAEGVCVGSNAECGNDICESTESNISCPRDCSVLSDWDAYNKEVSASTELKANLQCLAEFDCNQPIIATAMKEIESKYDTSTPIKTIDAITDWTNKLIDYDLNGGNSQCNEKASDLLTRYYQNGFVNGNCVDYSVVEIALLRYNKIPAIQDGVCVSAKTSWNCIPFSVFGLPSRAGYMRADQAMGHSIVRAYGGGDYGYLNVDPTLGTTISGACIGYSAPLVTGSISTVCYIPQSSYNQYCYSI